jgi:hypothetical protein
MYYMIRRRQDGLYSNGNTIYPHNKMRFTKTPYVWSSKSALSNHLRSRTGGQSDADIYAGCEVLEQDPSSAARVVSTVADWVRDLNTRRDK